MRRIIAIILTLVCASTAQADSRSILDEFSLRIYCNDNGYVKKCISQGEGESSAEFETRKNELAKSQADAAPGDARERIKQIFKRNPELCRSFDCILPKTPKLD